MGNNPLICDERIKWMKYGEQQRWLSFNYYYPNQQVNTHYPPHCENFPGTNWEEVSIPESDG